MKNRKLFLRQLDRQLTSWRTLKSSRPITGWIKTIRKALGLTAYQLAQRLGVQRSRIIQLEQAETADAITLRSLRAAAAALECELVYAFVPRMPLETIIKERAKEVATEIIRPVAYSMSLEDQGLEQRQLQENIEELADELMQKSLKNLWKKD